MTLHRQYEQETKEIRTDVEASREMNGQTVYFDADHHPIINENETKAKEPLVAPEEYSL